MSNCREEFEKWYTENDDGSSSEKALLRGPDGHYVLMQALLCYNAFEQAYEMQQEKIDEMIHNCRRCCYTGD